jgi:hypothetical protein
MKTFEDYLENHIQASLKVTSVYGCGYVDALYHIREVYNNLRRDDKIYQEDEEWQVL